MRSIILAFLLVTLCQAELVSWVCDGPGDFSNAKCWNTGKVPAAADDAMITNGPQLTVSQPVTVNSISLKTTLNGVLNLNAAITAFNIYVGGGEQPAVTFGSAFSSPNANFTLDGGKLIPSANLQLGSLYMSAGSKIDVSKLGAITMTTKASFVQGEIKVDSFSSGDALTWKSTSWTLNGPLTLGGPLTLDGDSGSNDIHFVKNGDKAPTIGGFGKLTLGAKANVHFTDAVSLAIGVTLAGKLTFSRTSDVRPSLALGANSLTTVAGSAIDVTSTFIDPAQASNGWVVVDTSVTETVKPTVTFTLPNQCSPASLEAGRSRGYVVLLKPYPNYKGVTDFTITKTGAVSVDFGVTAMAADPCVNVSANYIIYTSFIKSFSATHNSDGTAFTIPGTPIVDGDQTYSIDTNTFDVNYIPLSSTTDKAKKTFNIGSGGVTGSTKSDPTKTHKGSAMRVMAGVALFAALLF